jgi:hypothetical protein
MPEPIFMKFGMYITAPQPVSMVYFTNPSHQSVCLYVYAPIVARQTALLKRYHGTEYTNNNKRIVGCIVLYAVHVVSKETGD